MDDTSDLQRQKYMEDNNLTSEEMERIMREELEKGNYQLCSEDMPSRNQCCNCIKYDWCNYAIIRYQGSAIAAFISFALITILILSLVIAWLIAKP